MGFISNLILLRQRIFPSRRHLGSAGKNANIGIPTYIAFAKSLHMEENTVLRLGANILNTPYEHIYIKKYTVISTNCTIVTNNHRSTVGIPQVLLGASHINDTSSNLYIDEDVYVGTNVTILCGGNLGRGCIVGACSVVTKPVPPYALVVGTPARIVGVKFTIDQIIEHEKRLYPENERFDREYLEDLFEKYYIDKKVFGVQTDLSIEDQQKLDAAIKQRGFINK